MFQITDVSVGLTRNELGKLRAFVTVEIDHSFVITDIKIIEGRHGLFTCMPNRKVTDKCPQCRKRVALDYNYCGYCGAKQPGGKLVCFCCDGWGFHKVVQPSGGIAEEDCAECRGEGVTSPFVDVVHPIDNECRNYINREVLAVYHNIVAAKDYLRRAEEVAV